MKLTGLHLLLTYQCTFECDHCFVWGSPWQSGTMTAASVDHILQEGASLGTVNSIYFEGGEPFLYYATLLHGVRQAAATGFRVGIVSNAYWATSLPDARETLRPFAGLVADLSLSQDLYHDVGDVSARIANARAAAAELRIPLGTIQIAQPDEGSGDPEPASASALMYRGRATEVLASRATHHPWDTFTTCPYEDLRDPGRVHVDPLGHVHLCHGISLGNLFLTSLPELVDAYEPDRHPVAGPLLAGGPAALVTVYGVEHGERYADACHLCDEVRRRLRPRFPATLAPDQMYGVAGEAS
jgi:hypothetical protein